MSMDTKMAGGTELPIQRESSMWTRDATQRICNMFQRLAVIVVITMLASVTFAGGTSENLILVVNADSASSKNIANHYIRWRKIPPQNVIYLTRISKSDSINVDQFRDTMLKPIISEIQKRKLSAQVDYIVYSSGFPSRVAVFNDVKRSPHRKKIEGQKLFQPILSVNAMTYFLESVMQKKLGYLSLSGNWYYRKPAAPVFSTMFFGEDNVTYQSGRKDLQAGNYEQAQITFQTLAEKYKDNYALWYQISRCFAQQELATEAALAMIQAGRHGWQFTEFVNNDPNFDKVRSNAAFAKVVNSLSNEPFKYLPTEGFRSRYAWQPNGIRAEGKHTGRKFFLSTMLAVTSGRGTNDEQALRYLKAAVDSDFTRPQGKFYFAKTKDVRSRTRTPGFADAVNALKRVGYEGVIVESILPSNKDDILGCSIGRANFEWESAKSTIVGGAICENLTSYGGVLKSKGSSQTPLTEFLRYGAAGSSGTTCEPYAIQAKFPHPLIHAHYANGASLAEAYYQSVHAPYQLLIVGDPLCQPFAQPQKFETKGLQPNQEVKGEIEMEIVPASDQDEFSHFELFTDGRFRANLSVGRKVTFDSKELSDGYHELRIVGVANNRIETRSRKILPFMVNNQGQLVELKAKKATRQIGQNFDLTVKSTGAKRILVFQNSRVVATIEEPVGRIEISSDTLGLGPSTLFAVAEVNGKNVRSAPLEVQVTK